ncbi:NAD(P)-dependent oxidoreductase [Alloalcanivorax profundimaris]|uniref:NAD(P)-dependent oxidoreductase n=1 Tax=Alloalcanivorax profundimaris TaxID=2735259 RepID=UPI001886EE9E|nr:NAD(P)-dependent oxidoreductase [Alloalcanivorax profundimaris]MBF1800934.1 NAD(P)-dependent oxidoreductase [Alloalcanivorax profundimaris]MCQ6261838.1 NAD(P)-dependent oxidoreductase [Alcanivorax sp. MM125-6]
MTESITVAFIGLGNMGAPMVANLARAGFDLKLFDVDGERARRLAEEHGAAVAEGWANLADGARVVITMLPTGALVREVLLDTDGGLARHLAPGTRVVDMSSSEPLGTRALGEQLAHAGVALVDAPVSGGVPGAQAGTLSIMAGGDDNDIEAVMPVFEALGQRVFRVGPRGAGHACKALNNYVAAAAYTATAEALAIGTATGLDDATLVDVINHSTGRSFNSEVVFAKQVVPGTYQTGFALGLLAKDVGIAADLGRALGVDAPVSTCVQTRWRQAVESLGADCDQSRALMAWHEE